MKRLLALLATLSFYGALFGEFGTICCPYYYFTSDGTCIVYYGFQGMYWTVNQSNLDYAVDSDREDLSLTLGEGKTHFLDYNWHGGGRAWMGWNWGCGWDSKVIYTYFENEAKDHINREDSILNLKPSLLHPETGTTTADYASGKHTLVYQTLDTIYGRVLSFSENTFGFNPYCGIRALKLNQRLNVTYEGEVQDPIRVRWRSEIQALGLTSGINLQYLFRCGLGIYGGFGGSILSSRTEQRHTQKTLDEEDDDEELSTEIDLREKQHVMVSGYHLNGGLQWDCICRGTLASRIKIGYEFNQWLDTPQLRRYHANNEGVSNSSTAGHIGLHGATASIEFFF